MTGARVLSYFTVQSNVLVALTVLWLALDPSGGHRLWQVLRLNALVGITVTGIIYVTLLRPIVHLTGVPKLTDVVFHYVAPMLGLGLLFRWADRALDRPADPAPEPAHATRPAYATAPRNWDRTRRGVVQLTRPRT